MATNGTRALPSATVMYKVDPPALGPGRAPPRRSCQHRPMRSSAPWVWSDVPCGGCDIDIDHGCRKFGEACLKMCTVYALGGAAVMFGRAGAPDAVAGTHIAMVKRLPQPRRENRRSGGSASFAPAPPLIFQGLTITTTQTWHYCRTQSREMPAVPDEARQRSGAHTHKLEERRRPRKRPSEPHSTPHAPSNWTGHATAPDRGTGESRA
ncbi:hypothetical protein BP6252_02029 [Coleophoma cylindrospora]|uniref:Uncharacterized protein n=1 Tax=Coleophoma cylindrospora TaxID=1849047 RepID=A0A3D8SDP8_9HELO|nr:hypothetical protein BP6252_02029 [Coleophoma cylindrospora]